MGASYGLNGNIFLNVIWLSNQQNFKNLNDQWKKKHNAGTTVVAPSTFEKKQFIFFKVTQTTI